MIKLYISLFTLENNFSASANKNIFSTLIIPPLKLKKGDRIKSYLLSFLIVLQPFYTTLVWKMFYLEVAESCLESFPIWIGCHHANHNQSVILLQLLQQLQLVLH